MMIKVFLIKLLVRKVDDKLLLIVIFVYFMGIN